MSENKMVVCRIPTRGSRKTLKGHVWEAGDACLWLMFADEALASCSLQRKLGDIKFRSHEGKTTYIQMKTDVQVGEVLYLETNVADVIAEATERVAPAM